MLHLPSMCRNVGTAGCGVVAFIERVRVPGHQLLKDLQEVLEKVDIDEVGESCDASERGGKQRRGMRIF